MKMLLTTVFAGILALMIGVTTWASLERSVFDAGHLFADRWFVATFCDAYCGFITFYIWVAFRETSFFARLVWFVAIMGLGNIAVALYVLINIWRLEPSDAWDQLLLGRTASKFAEGSS
ncbi:MAG: DUF1475 domain-containing protein [Planctomycetes bacterium]|nr:DUF1475 domain-containing protein [Planctomycetota bacterium]